MPSLADHQSAKYVKLLVMGDSGTGKTGSLVSLVGAGYKLAILDFDNGLDVVAKHVRQNYPDKLDNIQYQTLRDRVKATPAGPAVVGIPKAYTTAIKLLDKWDPESLGLKGKNLGDTSKLGPEWVVVLDSLTFFSDAAFKWADAMAPNVKDKRQIFYTAQQQVAALLGILTSADFEVNVIVMSHVTYINREDGQQKGYPASVGKAQAETIPAYFNHVALTEAIGTPPKRSMRTASTALIDLKSPASLDAVDKQPIETALASYFEKARK